MGSNHSRCTSSYPRAPPSTPPHTSTTVGARSTPPTPPTSPESMAAAMSMPPTTATGPTGPTYPTKLRKKQGLCPLRLRYADDEQYAVPVPARYLSSVGKKVEVEGEGQDEGYGSDSGYGWSSGPSNYESEWETVSEGSCPSLTSSSSSASFRSSRSSRSSIADDEEKEKAEEKETSQTPPSTTGEVGESDAFRPSKALLEAFLFGGDFEWPAGGVGVVGGWNSVWEVGGVGALERR